MAKRSLKDQLKLGYVVRVKWLDAAFYGDLTDLDEVDVARGGSPLYTYGCVVNLTNKGVVLCSELDEKFDPNRDFNLIPLCLIQEVVLLDKNDWNGVK